MKSQSFPYRGFMLDVARHYMPVEDIHRLLDAAALCGLNRMHWHLTDDQGWRVEIRRFPKLTEVGAKRGRSFFGAVPEEENNDGFYTQDEVREIVDYAQARGIEIIPEVEVPGHASAMLAAYPEYGCARSAVRGGQIARIERPYDYHVTKSAGIFPNLICAGKDEAVRFLEAILDEIVELFPGSMVHIGGDEALKLHWRRCPDCQRRMREEGLESEEALQRWLVLKIGEYLAGKGKKVIVWNESLAGGLLPNHFIVQHWMGNDAETAAFMAQGGQVIVSDTRNYYFDYPYSTIDVYHLFNAPLVPDYAQGHEDRLLGIECPLWTERVTNIRRASRMLYPRLAAVALRLNGEDGAAWEDFRAALTAQMERLAPLGLAVAPEAFWRMSPEDAAADRAEEERLHHSPDADAAIAEERQLLAQERLEARLRAARLPEAEFLRATDAAWLRCAPSFCGGTGSEPGPDADALLERLLDGNT